ncbi:unnamed protein product [Prunus armeniaca]
MIGRADIEGLKRNVAMNAWLPQASYPCGNFFDTSSFKFRSSKGSIGHAFMVRIRTGNHNQTSFYLFVPHEISVLIELILGHLRYLITNVPPQPNSLLDNVFCPDRPSFEAAVRRPGKVLEGTLPVRPLAGTRQPALIAWAARRVRDWDPRAQPSEPILFPSLQIYFAKLPLSTLFHRPEDGRWGRIGHHATCSALPGWICTDGRFSRSRAPGFVATATPSYLSGPGTCPDGRVSAQLGTITRIQVHPASPVLLTKNGPLGAFNSIARLNKAIAPSDASNH